MTFQIFWYRAPRKINIAHFIGIRVDNIDSKEQVQYKEYIYNIMTQCIEINSIFF